MALDFTLSSYISNATYSSLTCNASVTVTEKSTTPSSSGGYSTVTIDYEVKMGDVSFGPYTSRPQCGYLHVYFDGSSKASITIPLNASTDAGATLCSGSTDVTINHDSDGKKTSSVYITIESGSDPGNINFVWAYTESSKQSLALTDIDVKVPSLTATLSSVTETSAVISVLSDSNCSAVYYRVGSSGSFTKSSLTLTANTQGSLAISGLTKNTSYVIYIYVTREENSLNSSTKSVTVSTDITAPIITLSVNTYDLTFVTINITSDSACSVGNYKVNDGDYSNVNYQFGLTGSNTVQFKIENLVEGTNYKFTFKALKDSNSMWSTEKTVTVTTNSTQMTVGIVINKIVTKYKVFDDKGNKIKSIYVVQNGKAIAMQSYK